MTILYSAATGGFYDTELHDTLPADACEISAADHAQLLADQAEGLQIVAGVDGRPIAVDPPPPSAEQAMAAVRRERDRLLDESDFRAMPDYPLGAAARAAWSAYRQALRDLPQAIENVSEIQWPEPPVATEES